MSFELVRQLQEKAVPVEQTCRVLEVSRSGYYAACHRSRVQPVVCEASDIADYIVSFYNSARLHSKLGNLPPNAFEHESAIKQPIGVCEIT